VILAVASGKGGTGKTTVAVGLALSLADAAHGAAEPCLLDCDVEEPNAALFLRPTLHRRRDVGLMIPTINSEACTACGRCAEVCRYNAIAVIGDQVLVFPELCHGCGSCTRQCPAGAITEELRVTGTLEGGRVNEGGIVFAQGTMAVGQAMATPIIRHLKQWAIPRDAATRPVILDAPPGTSCPVVATLRGVDGAVLVTEPTPFGLHDLKAAVKVARDELNLPVAVVVNRDGLGYDGVDGFCAAERIPILMRIPLARHIAEGISQGHPLTEIEPSYRAEFRRLYAEMGEHVRRGPRPRAVTP
jgi:MinD superfamily P-loop ATPase